MKNIGGNALVIKEVNINLVRRVLKDKKQATKRQIAEISGLSVVTVGTMLQHLIQQDEVLEGELISSSGGRPAQQYLYNEDFALALIVFPFEKEGSIFLHHTVVNLSGKIIHEADVEIEDVDLACFENSIDPLLDRYPSIGALGFGLPGAEYEGKMIVSDYEALLGISVTEHFRDRYHKPVVMENDVNAAVIGFCNRTQTGADSTVVYFYFPERFPPGAGIYINGMLYKGKRSFAGEVANIPLGIPWGEASLLESYDVLCEAIAKLTVAVSSVINPDVVVLYGSFLSPEHMKTLTELCISKLPLSAMPKIILTQDFAVDYLGGMIAQTLRTLEPNLQLTK